MATCDRGSIVSDADSHLIEPDGWLRVALVRPLRLSHHRKVGGDTRAGSWSVGTTLLLSR